MTTYVTEVPANCGWYHVGPHCWYVMPPTLTAVQDGGNV